jgi:hypothetical protein
MSRGVLCNRKISIKAVLSYSTLVVDDLTVVCQGMFTHRIIEITSKSFDQKRHEHLVSPADSAIALVSFHSDPDGHVEGPLTEKQAHHGTGKGSAKGGQCTYIFGTVPAPTIDWCDVARVTVDMLPDDALLEVFAFYVDKTWILGWSTLAHVCQQWRNIVFGSPRRLNLRLCYRARRPMRDMLDVWPLFPISIMVHGTWDVDNIVAALEHNDRIYELALYYISSLQLEKVLAAMQQPAPAMTRMVLRTGTDETAVPVVPASFLGGSAPCLQSLSLDGISFPGLPNLLLSATHLVHLDLSRIPHSGYISPEAMVTCLSALTRLKSLRIEFESSSQSLPDSISQRPPPPIRILLPVLTKLWFLGACEYIEDLVARIDAPLLRDLSISFFPQLRFDTTQLIRFIRRTPKLTAYEALGRLLHFGHFSIDI